MKRNGEYSSAEGDIENLYSRVREAYENGGSIEEFTRGDDVIMLCCPDDELGRMWHEMNLYGAAAELRQEDDAREARLRRRGLSAVACLMLPRYKRPK